MLKILLNGAKGRMGTAIQEVSPDSGIAIAYSIERGGHLNIPADQVDVIVDFSTVEGSLAVLDYALKNKKPILIGTTGFNLEQLQAIKSAALTIPVLMSGNYAIGVNVLFYLTELAAEKLGKAYHAEIMEIHHALKVDAPSGTALALAETIANARGKTSHLQCGREGLTGKRTEDEIGLHALRGGDVVGEHTTYFIGQGERLELTQRTWDRLIYARGALRAACWLVTQKAPGLYNMRDVLNLNK
ncbi:MAG: 4-hydroxy-tetrahydrodipicolinate reductase [Verrucomicrobia bacterium CG_4_10_14_3_um_filter_43_23]|nr:MAG: 4-hydroxy-tetrahydrodipicolinate reductase [Verrucomicrobia bacterium CG1_02_43_26]PIP60081.1 MAG: 4-hydroxy-tetrahydrodipicolinate reductase [Verrucomicrobia bacterium CG22_combo_CG10-13_8_21_14_all_43_17]PIX58672.1 MAG: 4-hydroxy-tetrahydrodipicolinate reductase [Verrucomicrobia bacterium CG_4_10_14_3_um_filter_43_23]PIY62621.1 MAG: 4-hydroxy-tetrahydrodipicolinate reductase [Verrucomicrobia bacterium CG_4_10_14_0_8_um_filter_43_34]PJA43306.1 MAG: 4-hydroxy-tetrahydrodipicolinate redu